MLQPLLINLVIQLHTLLKLIIKIKTIKNKEDSSDFSRRIFLVFREFQIMLEESIYMVVVDAVKVFFQNSSTLNSRLHRKRENIFMNS